MSDTDWSKSELIDGLEDKLEASYVGRMNDRLGWAARHGLSAAQDLIGALEEGELK